MSFKLIFYGGVGSTTGANIMLKFGESSLLVDCGLFQGGKVAEEKNLDPFLYDPKSVKNLIITHAHMDHIGRAPLLVKNGFNGSIISTKETKELALPMLLDGMKVFKMRHGGKELFNEDDIQKTMSLWKGFGYGEDVVIEKGCSLKMIDAGHILGSAILNLELIPPAPLYIKGGKKTSVKIVFTGDLGNSPSPLLPDTEIPEDVDFMIMESVYGDRNHESKTERREKLKFVLLDGIKRGGTIVIPAFSIERTQVLLYEINNMIEDGEIPATPVFLDSPLALKATHIYKKYKNDFKASVKKEIKEGDDIFDFPGLRIIEKAEESKEIEKTEGPKIILAGSGMSEGGRIVNHESRILSHAENTLMLVGYQSVGTLGRMLQDGAKEVEIDHKKIKVRAKIESIMGYSSHKDSEHLLEFVEKVSGNNPPHPPHIKGGAEPESVGLKKVFVIMGEPKSSLFLAQRIRDYLDIEAIYPEEGREYELK